MLVLTTMFINVSNNLPKTSYVKMIDVWLIFNLLLPFIEVLVHTYMDTLRSRFYYFSWTSCVFFNWPFLFSTKVKKVNKQIRGYLRWSILWISSFGWLVGIFHVGPEHWTGRGQTKIKNPVSQLRSQTGKTKTGRSTIMVVLLKLATLKPRLAIMLSRSILICTKDWSISHLPTPWQSLLTFFYSFNFYQFHAYFLPMLSR